MSGSRTAWSYMCYGCSDLINDARTVAYYYAACAEGTSECISRFEPVDPCYCDADGVPEDYVSPAADAVCWYDPDLPESAEFLGLLVSNVVGDRDSTYTREVTDSVTVGSVIQRERLAGRVFGFEVVLLATTCAGMEYGIEYVRRVLENAACGTPDTCERCTGRQMRARIYCDVEDVPVGSDRGLRDWVTVATTDGLTLIDDPTFNCCCVRKATFTMTSREPYSFSSKQQLCVIDADPLAFEGCIDWTKFCADCASQLCIDCKESCSDPLDVCENCRLACGDCDRCFYDPVCVNNNVVLVTPTFTAQESCFCEPLNKIIQCCAIDDTLNNIDTTLRLSLYSGRHATDPVFNLNGLRNARLKIWTNVLGLPPITDNASWALWKSRATCIEYDVSYIPPDSTLIIDGRSQRVMLECNGVCKPYDKVVSATVGGPVFPMGFSCTSALVCIEWSEYGTQFDASANNLPSRLTVESYLRWRS